MLVYRVQHKETGLGPYHPQTEECKLLKRRLCDSHDDIMNPALCDAFNTADADRIIKNEYVFGFLSLEELYTWFDGFIQDLCQCGYEIVIYDVGDDCVCIGHKQVAFNVVMAQRLKPIR